MANIGKWNTPRTIATLLSTELNSLGNGSLSAAGPAIDNSANLDLYCDIWVHLGALSPGVGGFLTLYILEAIDGSTFPAASAALRNQPAQQLTSVSLDTTAATAQDIIIRNVLLPPGKFEVVLDNQSGVALAASGNTIKAIAYNVNENG